MATPDDRLARLLKNAAQAPAEPIAPLAASRADDVVRAWRAAQTHPAEEVPWLGFAWRGVAAACAVMVATCALYASSPETTVVSVADDTSLSSDPELFAADSATLLALQP
ncbi:MAG: hypothetical protein JSR82_16940 [Verrucomicrobia bacterium]|nr:hypothetical protein [Verrucomicrobiota bacterium]